MVQYTSSVQEYMTPNPYSIASDERVLSAEVLMRRYGVRHLPVLSGGKLVGIVSERDVKIVQTLPKHELSQLTIEDVMTREPYSTSPTAPLTQTAREMARDKHECAVVVNRDKVVGILTTTDALDALAEALEGKHVRSTFEQTDIKPPRGRTRPLTARPASRRGAD